MSIMNKIINGGFGVVKDLAMEKIMGDVNLGGNDMMKGALDSIMTGNTPGSIDVPMMNPNMSEEEMMAMAEKMTNEGSMDEVMRQLSFK